MSQPTSNRTASRAGHSFAVLVLVGLSMAMVGAGCEKSVPHSKSKETPPAKVLFERALELEVTDHEVFTGRLEASKRIELQARVTGFLKKVHIHGKEGGTVKEGELLFEIDPLPYQAEVARAQGAVRQAEAKLKRLKNDLDRTVALLRTRAISKEEHERVSGEHAEAAAAVDSAKASLDSAKLFLRYTKIEAPIDGRVGRTLLDEGNLVKADSTFLTTLVSESPIFAYFDVDERTGQRLPRLLAKQTVPSLGATKVPVSLALVNEEDFPHKGYLDFEDTVIDPATGTRRMRGVFKNEKDLFTPGMFVRVRLQVGQPEIRTVVFEQGVGTDQSQKFVYVVGADNKAEYRKVKTGGLWKVETVKKNEDGKDEKYWKRYRIIEEGLQPGERVIVSGLQRVRTGAVVAPSEAKLE